MRVKPGILLIMGLFFLAGTVAAVGIPDTLTVTTDKPWIIANNLDQSTITIKVTNTTFPYSGDVPGVIVNLEVDPLYGNISPTQVTTNLSGMASSTFKVSNKSGAAQINASIPAGISGSTMQNIDHNSAYFADFSHPMNGTVASEVPFNISLTDQYRNPVDNRRGNHIINLHVSGPAPDDCGFAETGYAHDVTRILDANGNTSVNVKLTSRVGDNNIAMDAYESIPNQLEWITAEAIGKPFSMTQVYSPSGSPPTLPADGVSYFTIIYSLFDEYGNPTNKQFIWVNTSVTGEERQFLSNNLGQVTVQYGPRNSIGEIDITATSVANSTLALTQRIIFKDTGAAIISLTGNPATMPSHDVPPSTFVSNIVATVADVSGNAVNDTIVTFTLENETYEGTYNVTAHPSLSSSSSLTNKYGQAVVQFTPGSFTTAGNTLFNASATGHCNVNATWNNTKKIIPLTWKNYPFLSVKTSTDRSTVEINQTVNVSIAFTGDGWAFTQPSDVVLVTDLSGSMAGTKLTGTKAALKKFVGMSDGKLSIALASYSNAPVSYSTEAQQLYNIQKNNASAYPFNPYATEWTRMYGQPGNPDWYSDAKIDLDFTNASTNLNNTINTYGAKGGTCIGCGLGAAMSEFNMKGDPTHPKVIIIMSDGIANLAPINSTFPLKAYLPSDYKSSTDTSNTAKAAAISIASIIKDVQKIKIYTIAFGSDADTATLTSIASPGCNYIAADNTALSEVYAAIYAEVSDPGVDTTMSTDFQYINVTGVTIPGADVYTYVPSTKIGWQDGKINFTDQTTDWADHKLDFTIGTIKLKEQWNATFRLKVNQSGLIDVFGNHSTVTFNGGTQTLYLPQTFITVVPNLTVTNITGKTITLDNLMITENGEIKVLLPVTWSTNYTGNKTLTEKIKYCIKGRSSNCVDTGDWVIFDTVTHTYDPYTMEYVDFAQLDVTKLPPGDFKIQVRATASDAPDAVAETGFKPVGGRGKTFIKLEAPPFENFEPLFNQNPLGVVDSRSI
ncbi:MAG TPA: hypothetical protein DSN98_09090 [Thermoplasmata archaeon]|nr:MAG TPA: hypothetical protein DSN98_09090 [Thermoplasmata archaeon]